MYLQKVSDNELDAYNQFYDVAEEEDDVVIDQSNNSVITHLLSQVSSTVL